MCCKTTKFLARVLHRSRFGTVFIDWAGSKVIHLRESHLDTFLHRRDRRQKFGTFVRNACALHCRFDVVLFGGYAEILSTAQTFRRTSSQVKHGQKSGNFPPRNCCKPSKISRSHQRSRHEAVYFADTEVTFFGSGTLAHSTFQ